MRQVSLFSTLFLAVISFSAHAGKVTTWEAGSKHRGEVIIPIEGGAPVVWQCDGKKCSMSGPWGKDLSLVSCQNLATQVGMLSYYQNSAGKLWGKNSKQLNSCNAVAHTHSH